MWSLRGAGDVGCSCWNSSDGCVYRGQVVVCDLDCGKVHTARSQIVPLLYLSPSPLFLDYMLPWSSVLLRLRFLVWHGGVKLTVIMGGGGRGIMPAHP